jgi:hypothetical protein
MEHKKHHIKDNERVTDYAFKIQDIGGIPYRLPQINFKKKPYGGGSTGARAGHI